MHDYSFRDEDCKLGIKNPCICERTVKNYIDDLFCGRELPCKNVAEPIRLTVADKTANWA